MKTTGSAFSWIDGKPFIIANFDLDPSLTGCPSLPELLEQLLGKYPGSDILILRRLNSEEKELLEDCIREREHEAWAYIVAKKRKE